MTIKFWEWQFGLCPIKSDIESIFFVILLGNIKNTILLQKVQNYIK